MGCLISNPVADPGGGVPCPLWWTGMAIGAPAPVTRGGP